MWSRLGWETTGNEILKGWGESDRKGRERTEQYSGNHPDEKKKQKGGVKDWKERKDKVRKWTRAKEPEGKKNCDGGTEGGGSGGAAGWPLARLLCARERERGNTKEKMLDRPRLAEKTH